jgi:hypothetical protein
MDESGEYSRVRKRQAEAPGATHHRESTRRLRSQLARRMHAASPRTHEGLQKEESAAATAEPCTGAGLPGTCLKADAGLELRTS